MRRAFWKRRTPIPPGGPMLPVNYLDHQQDLRLIVQPVPGDPPDVQLTLTRATTTFTLVLPAPTARLVAQAILGAVGN